MDTFQCTTLTDLQLRKSKQREGKLITRDKKNLQQLNKAFFKEIKNIKPRVDTRAPFFHTDTYLKPIKLFFDYLNLQTKKNENAALLQRINEVRRSPAKVGSLYNPLVGLTVITERHFLINYYGDEVERENNKLYKAIQNARSKLPTNKELLRDWKKFLDHMRLAVQYPIVLPDLLEYTIPEEAKNDLNRPLIFIDFAFVEGVGKLGRIVVMLYHDLAPKTVNNFLRLCRKPSTAEMDNPPPSYHRTIVYRIFPNLFCECGDTEYNNGCGGLSADGSDFNQENFELPHSCPGTLAMIPNEKGTVNSLFSISFVPLNVLNGRRTAFGRVIKGERFLDDIMSFGTIKGTPRRLIEIRNCGLL